MPDDNQNQITTPPSDNAQSSETPISTPATSSIPTTDSTPSDVPPVTPEASQDAFTMPPNKDQNEAVNPAPDESLSEVKQESSQTEAQNEPVSEPPQSIEAENSATLPSQTPQTSTFEPFVTYTPQNSQTTNSQNHMKELLDKEHIAIENKRRKKLDSIMNLLAKQENITNDEVEKFLHVSNATATRYLSILKKENKIMQNGKTGKSVFYTKAN